MTPGKKPKQSCGETERENLLIRKYLALLIIRLLKESLRKYSEYMAPLPSSAADLTLCSSQALEFYRYNAQQGLRAAGSSIRPHNQTARVILINKEGRRGSGRQHLGHFVSRLRHLQGSSQGMKEKAAHHSPPRESNRIGQRALTS